MDNLWTLNCLYDRMMNILLWWDHQTKLLPEVKTTQFLWYLTLGYYQQKVCKRQMILFSLNWFTDVFDKMLLYYAVSLYTRTIQSSTKTIVILTQTRKCSTSLMLIYSPYWLVFQILWTWCFCFIFDILSLIKYLCRYMAGILPIRRKTPNNQSINRAEIIFETQHV